MVEVTGAVERLTAEGDIYFPPVLRTNHDREVIRIDHLVC